jgi:hypothetical protein
MLVEALEGSGLALQNMQSLSHSTVCLKTLTLSPRPASTLIQVNKDHKNLWDPHALL